MTIKFYKTGSGLASAEYLGAWEDGTVTEDKNGQVADLLEEDIIFDGPPTAEDILGRYDGPYITAVKTSGERDEDSGVALAAAVPENAVSIRDPSDAPAGTSTIQGPMGGWYYVPVSQPGADGETESEPTAPREDPSERFAPTPDEDVPAFRESEESTAWVEDLHAVQYENGFTLNSDLTRYDGLGYVATITSDNFTHPEAGGEGVSKDAIVDLYERMLPVLEEFPGIAKLGTFYGDDGYMSVDLNIVTDDRELAEAIGRANNQQAIWDLYEMAPINTNGDGESPVDASDPRAVLEFIRDIVTDGREAQALAALTPEASEATVTEYETATGERVSGLELFGKVKSGVWDIVDTDGEMWAVEDEEGEVMVLTATNAGASEMPDGEEGEEENGREAADAGTEADTDRFISPFTQVPASDDYTDEEAAFHAMYEDVLWDEQAAGRELFAGTRMPDNVRDRMVSAIRQGALFPEFEAMNDSQRAELREYLLDAARGGGWTMREVAERLRRIDPTLTQYEAERIARTETQAIVTTARELWYESEGDFVAEDTLFIWNGPQDGRTTDACEWLKEQANPRYGGEPKTLEELRELVEEASKRFFPDLDVRRWTVHPHERHTVVRYYEVGA